MPIVLFGSGEFTNHVDEIDRYLIDNFKPKSIGILSTAAGQESDVAKWFEMAKEHYQQFDVKVVTIPIFNHLEANNPDLVDMIEDVDWIFLSGGSPGYLNETLNDSLLLQRILKKQANGTLLAGSSAGAMVLGKYIITQPFKVFFSKSEATWQPAIGLVDYVIFPHFNHLRKFKKLINQIIAKSPANQTKKWLGIDEDTAILFYDNKQLILGGGKVDINDH